MLISLSIVFSADEAFPFLVLFGGGIGRSERVEELRFDEEVTKGVDNVSLSFPGGEYTPVCLSRLGFTRCDTCTMVKNEIQLTTDSDKRDMLSKLLEKHNAMQTYVNPTSY